MKLGETSATSAISGQETQAGRAGGAEFPVVIRVRHRLPLMKLGEASATSAISGQETQTGRAGGVEFRLPWGQGRFV